MNALELPALRRQIIRDLTLTYPGWVFAVRETYSGLRIEAYRPDGEGLYALIGTESELRKELDAADMSLAS